MFAKQKNRAKSGLDAFHLKGIQEGDAQRGDRQLPPFHIAATGFLKLWVVVCFEAQSFVGLADGKEENGGGSGPNVHRLCLLSVSTSIVDTSILVRLKL